MQLIISEIGKSSPSDKTRNKMVMFCCQDQKYGSHVYLFCPGIEKSRRIDKAKNRKSSRSSKDCVVDKTGIFKSSHSRKRLRRFKSSHCIIRLGDYKSSHNMTRQGDF